MAAEAGKAEAEGSNGPAGGGAEPKRDDMKALASILQAVQNRIMDDSKLDKPLPEVDQQFLTKVRREINMGGLMGGLTVGGPALLLTRKMQVMARMPVVVMGWLGGSALGRFVGVDIAVNELLRLPQSSDLGNSARRIAREMAEPGGYFEQRYHFDLKSGTVRGAAKPGEPVSSAWPRTVPPGGAEEAGQDSDKWDESAAPEDGAFRQSESFLQSYFEPEDSEQQEQEQQQQQEPKDHDSAERASQGHEQGHDGPAGAALFGAPGHEEQQEAAAAAAAASAAAAWDPYGTVPRPPPAQAGKTWEDIRRERGNA